MEIKQAIEILSSRNETNKLFCENRSTEKSKWSDYDKFISEDSQAAELALTALKEKQEREENNPLTWLELKARRKKPVFYMPFGRNRKGGWIFPCGFSKEKDYYMQIWFFAAEGFMSTALYYDGEFYDYDCGRDLEGENG